MSGLGVALVSRPSRVVVGGGDIRRIRVVVVSDIRLCCSGLASMLDARPGIEVVGAASTMHELRTHVEGAAIDVALLDVSPTREHLRTLRTVVEAERGARFVAMA